MTPEPLIEVDPTAPAPSVVACAVAVLRDGGTIAFPTDTLYGLSADATRADAVARVGALKSESVRRPYVVLIEGLAQLEALAAEIPRRALPYVDRWPAPLTLILRAAAGAPAHVVSDAGGIAVRWPQHVLSRALIGELGAPIVSTSANPTRTPPATTAGEVLARLPGVDLVLDGGPARERVPSTIVDLTDETPRIVRAGALTDL